MPVKARKKRRPTRRGREARPGPLSGLGETGQFGEAEALFREALEAQPEAPDLGYNLAVCLLTQGRKAEGEAALRDIHARCPDYLPARRRWPGWR